MINFMKKQVKKIGCCYCVILRLLLRSHHQASQQTNFGHLLDQPGLPATIASLIWDIYMYVCISPHLPQFRAILQLNNNLFKEAYAMLLHELITSKCNQWYLHSISKVTQLMLSLNQQVLMRIHPEHILVNKQTIIICLSLKWTGWRDS